MKLSDLLQEGYRLLQEKKIIDAKRSCEEILAHFLKIRRLDLFLHLDEKIAEEKIHTITEAIKRRSLHEPLAYVLGEVSFYGCTIKVNPHVLIPRQETEILVDLIAEKIKGQKKGKILWDICTGSGCIGIALKKKFPSLKVVIGDISKKALEVAKENANLNQAEVQVLQSDLFSSFENKKADVIVINPPYVSEDEYLHLEQEVKEHEPKIALTAKDNGLYFYKKIAQELFQYMDKGLFFCEIGKDQGEEISNIFYNHLQIQGKIIQDYAGNDRFFFLEIE